MIIPSVLVMLLMHVLIIFNTVRINDMGGVIAAVTQRNFQLGGLSTDYSQGTDALGNMAMSFVNSGSEENLDGYFEKLSEVEEDYNGMMRMLEEQHTAEDEMRAKLLPHAQASEGDSAEARLKNSYYTVLQRAEVEKKAIAMAARARGVELDAYPQLKDIALPDEPEGLPEEAKIARARELLTDPNYQSLRGGVQRNLSVALSMANTVTAGVIQRYSDRLATYRLEQWILIAVIVVTMLAMIVLLFTGLLIPLEKSVELVQHGQMLSDKHGFSELRRLGDVL